MVARVVLMILFAGLFQSPTAPRRGGNPEAARIKNPVEGTAGSIAAGKRSYQRLCGRCHGPAGKGDGTAATGVQPPDLTDAQWDFDGTSADMDGYAARLSDADIWNVVSYLRTLSAASP
jgi:mono/diheme cytochrome c family protein